MLSWFSSGSKERHKAAELYGAVVAAARQPEFYRDCGVSDTPDGRYELIVLHLALLADRLGQAGREGSELARAVAERFVIDMDDCMREMGVGDLTVPRKVKKAAAGLYERAEAYRGALRGDDLHRLASTLSESVPGVEAGSAGARRLAACVHAAVCHLEAQETGEILAGRVSFPVAGEVVTGGAA